MSAVLSDFISAIRSVFALFRRRFGGAKRGETNSFLTRQNCIDTDAAAFGQRGNGFASKRRTAVPVEAFQGSASDPIGLDALFGLQNASGAWTNGGFEQDGAAILVTDFDPDEDMLVVETQEDEEVCVTSQTVVADGVLVAFDNGSTVLLQGLCQEIPIASIIFVAPESEKNGNSMSTGGHISTTSTEFLSAAIAPASNIADPCDLGGMDGFAPKDMRSAPQANCLRLAASAVRSSATLTLHGPVILEQNTTGNGIFLTLFTGNTVLLTGPDAPINPARIPAQSPEMASPS